MYTVKKACCTSYILQMDITLSQLIAFHFESNEVFGKSLFANFYADNTNLVNFGSGFKGVYTEPFGGVCV